MNKVVQGVLILGWIPTLAIAAGVRGFGAADAGSVPTEASTLTSYERTPVRVTRIYTGEDGQTHAEEIDWPLGPPRGATELSEAIPIESVQFRRTSPDYLLDFHTAPRAQFVITLSGQSEIELGDGTTIFLSPGHILLAEDTTGQGHISRAVGSEDRISLFLPLSVP